MSEYHTLRVLVALGAGWMAWTSRKSTARIVPAYWAVLAIAMAIPQMLWTEWWKIRVSAPRECLTTLLSATVTAEAVWMTVAPRAARRALLGWSVALAVAICIVGWQWNPERLFQGIMIGRQYVALVVALASTIVLIWVRWLRPTASVLDGWWVLWTWTLVALAITTKGGLLWSVASWKGGLDTWLAVCDAALLVQIALIGWKFTGRWRMDSHGDAPVRTMP